MLTALTRTHIQSRGIAEEALKIAPLALAHVVLGTDSDRGRRVMQGTAALLFFNAEFYYTLWHDAACGHTGGQCGGGRL